MYNADATDYLGWQEKVRTAKSGDYPHMAFNAAERLSFLKIFIGCTTFDILYPEAMRVNEIACTEPSTQQQIATVNRNTKGFPQEAFATFGALTETERAIVRQNLQRTLLVRTEKDILSIYLPIQVLFQIIEDSDIDDLFPTEVTQDAAKNVAHYDFICGLLEWLLWTDINNETSTAYTLCTEIAAILRRPDLLPLYEQLIKEEAKEQRTMWNAHQRKVISRQTAKNSIRKSN